MEEEVSNDVISYLRWCTILCSRILMSEFARRCKLYTDCRGPVLPSLINIFFWENVFCKNYALNFTTEVCWEREHRWYSLFEFRLLWFLRGRLIRSLFFLHYTHNMLLFFSPIRYLSMLREKGTCLCTY